LLSRKFAEKLVLPVLGADDEVCDKEIQVSIREKPCFQGQVIQRFCSEKTLKGRG
jgi:hypothetical protein